MKVESFTCRGRLHRDDQREYRLYAVLLLPLTLLVVLMSRLLGSPRIATAGPRRNFFADVLELNRSTVPWIFGGR